MLALLMYIGWLLKQKIYFWVNPPLSWQMFAKSLKSLVIYSVFVWLCSFPSHLVSLRIHLSAARPTAVCSSHQCVCCMACCWRGGWVYSGTLFMLCESRHPNRAVICVCEVARVTREPPVLSLIPPSSYAMKETHSLPPPPQNHHLLSPSSFLPTKEVCRGG